MSKINKNSINYGLKTLALLAFALIFIPLNTSMAAYGANIGDYNLYGPTEEVQNPKPALSMISPKSGDRGTGARTVTITGDGFFPGSIARINGSNRYTTFIDRSHLLVQVTSGDMYQNDGFYVTVWNSAPGGGYSNAVFFTIKNTVAVSSNTNSNYSNSNTSSNYSNSNYSNSTNSNSNNYSSSSNSNIDQNTNNGEDGRYSNFASNVVFGSANSFMPNGIVQWVLLAIIILIIVILARKVFGGEEHFHNTPLKHA